MKHISSLAIILAFCSMPVLADTHQSGKITRMIVEGDKESNKVVSLWLENQPTNGECPASDRWVIEFAYDGMAKEKYSQLLSAAVAKQTVGLHYLSAQGCGFVGAKRVYYTDISY